MGSLLWILLFEMERQEQKKIQGCLELNSFARKPISPMTNNGSKWPVRIAERQKVVVGAGHRDSSEESAENSERAANG